MPTKREKGIWLDFPEGWGVVKYDGDSQTDNAGFYRAKIEHQVQHVRGVDVVSLTPTPDNRLLLIEVKDYRESASSADKEAKKLRQTVIQKALNTVSGLFAAARTGDPELREVTERICSSGLAIEVILLLEQPSPGPPPITTAQKFRKQNPQTAINDLRLELTSVLSGLGFDFYLRSSSTMQVRDGWGVRLI
ncbi:hypothetical protein GKZ68_00335 [Hymenobacter sp. BRD128]|uniref:hypothetical protein n=1 Tax=Hymenobacter sp. BRD128 TaxID=2675878 RepID=UPI001565C89E|nr:hypothetical protein [Hymenobacter sp. BRD128]QKG55219.1 hypothetical protein GKZ68_00335 [Hymenobacter sp. BRD128]